MNRLSIARPGKTAGSRLFFALLGLLWLAPNAAAAHDFWIEPTDFAPPVGRAVGLGLWSGDGFEGSPVPRDSGRMSRFALLDGSGLDGNGPDGIGESAVEGAEGVHPAGFVTPRTAGPHWVVFETHTRRLELPAARFERYLREEGLERIVERRGELAEGGLPGRESYRRCAKSLLEVGGPGEELGAAVAGCTLELVLEATPRAAAAAGRVAVRLLYDGRPLSGAKVAALRRGAPGRPLEARTDLRGRVSFPLAEPDVWLVKAVHMERAADPGSAVDWVSWWASLTVRLPAAGKPAAP